MRFRFAQGRALTIVLAVAASVVTVIGQQAPLTPEARLGAAQHQAEVEGNFEKAIATYKEVIADRRATRATVATALLQLAGVYEKAGRAVDARAAYGQIAKEYGDQAPVAARARAELGAAQAAGPSTARVLEVGEAWDRISPDGRYLARVDSETSNLELRELATGRTRPLTSAGKPGDPDWGAAAASAFSRDGRQIAYQWGYVREGKGAGTLRVVDTAEGSDRRPRVLFDNPEVGNVAAPTDWSRDGKWIAAVIPRRTDNTAQVGLVNVAEGIASRAGDRGLVQGRRAAILTGLHPAGLSPPPEKRADSREMCSSSRWTAHGRPSRRRHRVTTPCSSGHLTANDCWS